LYLLNAVAAAPTGKIMNNQLIADATVGLGLGLYATFRVYSWLKFTNRKEKLLPSDWLMVKCVFPLIVCFCISAAIILDDHYNQNIVLSIVVAVIMWVSFFTWFYLGWKSAKQKEEHLERVNTHHNKHPMDVNVQPLEEPPFQKFIHLVSNAWAFIFFGLLIYALVKVYFLK